MKKLDWMVQKGQLVATLRKGENGTMTKEFSLAYNANNANKTNTDQPRSEMA